MADYYVDSIGGSNSNNGTTWALRKKYLFLNDGADPLNVTQTLVAGDIVHMTHNHSETNTTSIIWSPGVTASKNPLYLISVDSTDGDSYQVASNDQLIVTGAGNDFQFNADGFFVRGIQFNIVNYWAPGEHFSVMHFDACTVSCNLISLGLAYSCRYTFRSCTFTTTATAGGLALPVYSFIDFYDCTFKPINLDAADYFIAFSNDSCVVNFYGCDFTDGDNDVFGKLQSGDAEELALSCYNCRIPPSMILNASPPMGGDAIDTIIRTVGCYSGTSASQIPSYQYDHISAGGTVKSEIGVYLTTPTGASDGTTSYSWKVTGVAAQTTRHCRLSLPPISKYIEATGSAQTIRIYFTSDDTAITKDQFWAELLSGDENATCGAKHQMQTTEAAFFATGGTHSINLGTWTGAKAETYYIDFTIQPTEHCVVTVNLYLADDLASSASLYVDPKIHIIV